MSASAKPSNPSNPSKPTSAMRSPVSRASRRLLSEEQAIAAYLEYVGMCNDSGKEAETFLAWMYSERITIRFMDPRYRPRWMWMQV